MLRSAVALAFGRALSVTRTVKVDVLFFVGVPEITPELLSVSPAGSDPAIRDHV
jgi:hypothetical protein